MCECVFVCMYVRVRSTASLPEALQSLRGEIPRQLVLRACNPALRSVGTKALEEAGVQAVRREDVSEIRERAALLVGLLTSRGAVEVKCCIDKHS